MCWPRTFDIGLQEKVPGLLAGIIVEERQNGKRALDLCIVVVIKIVSEQLALYFGVAENIWMLVACQHTAHQLPFLLHYEFLQC